jgi:hypothetical protein
MESLAVEPTGSAGKMYLNSTGSGLLQGIVP